MSLFTDIQHRTIDDAGCAVWRFSCCNGHPAMRKDGKTMLVNAIAEVKEALEPIIQNVPFGDSVVQQGSLF